MNLPLWASVGVGLGLATAIAYVATPVAILAARRLAFYDRPGGLSAYKGHINPTPYLGGAAVMFAFAFALLVGATHLAETLPLLLGVGLLLILGTIDDWVMVSPGLRVALEFALAAVLSVDGLGWRLGSGGALDAVITGIWVVGVVNAFNLFDNMDGAASTMALVVTAGACILALATGAVWVAVASATLCGSCLGFLPHNLSSPSKIFLGDGGSMPLGFAVATLVAMAAQHAHRSALALLVGFLLVGIPALDTTLVIVSRRRRGIPLLTGGRDHLTHRTRHRLKTPCRVALVLGGIQASVSALVIAANGQSSSTLVYIVLAFVVFGAAAIAALEDAIPGDEGVSGKRALAAERVRIGGSKAARFAAACVVFLGLAAGVSPLFSAYYDVGVWVPIGFVLVVAAAIATIARPPHFTLPVILTLAGISGLGLWSLISVSWAHAAEQAEVSANLWLSYSALLLLLVVLVSRRRLAMALLIAAGVGITAVGVSVLVRLLGSDPADMFILGRLNSPLGYVNGEGCVFAMGAWLTLALAERREAMLAAVGAAATVAMASLALLSQSRGTAIATVVALILALGVVPGFRRRVLALAFVTTGLVSVANAVTRVYSAGATGTLSPSVAHHAAVVIVLAALATGLLWGLLIAVVNRLGTRSAATAGLLRRGATVAAASLVAAPMVAAVIQSSSIRREVHTQLHAFVHLTVPTTGSKAVQTRLFSGAGNRYDYWRIAWHAFIAHPIAGVGAGNYPEYYFRYRKTQEAIQNPHSLELQTLAELGVVGAALLALFLAGLLVGARRLRRAARSSPAARTVMVASVGTSVVWLVDTSADWMHLIPGVTATALCAVAALVQGKRPGDYDSARMVGGRQRILLGSALAALLLAMSGASLMRAGLARHYLDKAKGAFSSMPGAAISDAEQALRLDAADLDAYYIKAAAQARFNAAAAAKGTLLQAIHEDPESSVTWTLLGDLEVRVGNLDAASSYYRHAHILDPREPGLAELVTNPGSGLLASNTP